ncbi:MAG: helix-turn-helix domain-containing protein [Patescibacteria group bacterium]
MAIFCLKKIESPVRLGERLRKAREGRGLTLEEIVTTTHIPLEYLAALEESNFSKLPKARGYRLAYLREYAEALELSPSSCLHQFHKEEGWEDIKNIHPRKDLKISRFYSLSFLARNILIAIFVLAFAGYLIWQVRGILEPPQLAIFFPPEGAVSDKLNIVVQGETEKESRLSINGQEIMINEQGRFESMVDLSEGLNTVIISATKKHGKTTTITRHIVAKTKKK